MWIFIKQRYKPFTHTPGVKVLLPGTKEPLQIYPTTFKSDGVEGFTVMLDLEKGNIVVFGKQFKHTISNPKKVLLERISFGVHKKQEWEGVAKRCNVEEFLPLWYHVSQWYDEDVTLPKNSLLESCFKTTDRIELTKTLEQLFHTGFSNLFFPESIDLGRRGFKQEPLGKGVDPTLLLSLGKKLIRSFFFKNESDRFYFLSFVPKGIHCGRFLNIQETDVRMDFEWTKHLPRRLVLDLKRDKKITFIFPSEIKEFRIKNLNKRYPNGSEITLLPGQYLFDQFKK